MPTRLDGVRTRPPTRSRYNSVVAIDELRLESDRRLATVLLTLVLIPAVWFGVVDALALPGGMATSLGLLLPHVLSAMVALLGLWFVARARTRAQYSLAVFATSLAIVPVLLAIGLQQPRGWFYEPSQAFLPLVALYGALPNSSGRQIGPPVLLTAGLVAGRVLWFSGAGGDALSETMQLTIVNAIGIVMVSRRNALQDMVADAFEELHVLRGIIPICAHCKKVRTNADEWQQIEKYVHEHSAAEFSHGICPDCLRKFYADDADPAPR